MKLVSILLISLFAVSISVAELPYGIDASLLKLSSPPKPGSVADQNDTKTLLNYQKTRTKEQCVFANSHTLPSALSLFGPRNGVLTKDEFLKVKNLVSQMISISEKVSNPFKKHYARARPFNRGLGIEPCISRPGGQTSYPSSHAMMGLLSALALAEVFPVKKEMIIKYGYQIGLNRVLGGVHHPSDVNAGQALAQQVWMQISEQSEFISMIHSL
jgi:acid phosphatase (class A)